MINRTPEGLAYDSAGSGNPVLLCLPGWCGPRGVFDPLLPGLAATHRTLALDWRGHGDSASQKSDFGTAELVDDVVRLLEYEGVESVVPIALSHAGFVALELRRRLGAGRVPKVVLVDWMVAGAPPPFLEALAAMANPVSTRDVVAQVLDMWGADLDIPALHSYLKEMDATEDEMWQRAAREIGAGFAADPIPLDALKKLDEPPRTLHLFAQPADPGVLAAQQDYARANPWFDVSRLDARSHFPMFEVPRPMVEAITTFVTGS